MFRGIKEAWLSWQLEGQIGGLGDSGGSVQDRGATISTASKEMMLIKVDIAIQVLLRLQRARPKNEVLE